jgi:hypothetical protein
MVKKKIKKSNWRSLPAWAKGGIIGAVLGVILGAVGTFVLHLCSLCSLELGCTFNFLTNIRTAFMMGASVGLVFFIVGAIVGWSLTALKNGEKK